MATTAAQVLSLANAKLAVGQKDDLFDDFISDQVKAAIGVVSEDLGTPLVDEEFAVRVRRAAVSTGRMLFNTPVPVRSLGQMTLGDTVLVASEAEPFTLDRLGTANWLIPSAFGREEWPEFDSDPVLTVTFGQDLSGDGDGSGIPAKYVQAVVLVLRNLFRGDAVDRRIYNALVGLPPPEDGDD
ncbi:MAG: hypothetical protein OXH70_17815 [Acidobacteria bacterium]|nr:hypothetical protein [Acidobacteriota bacterium]